MKEISAMFILCSYLILTGCVMYEEQPVQREYQDIPVAFEEERPAEIPFVFEGDRGRPAEIPVEFETDDDW